MKQILYLSLLATACIQGASNSSESSKGSTIPWSIPFILSEEAERAYKLETLTGLSACNNKMIEVKIDLGPNIEPRIINVKQLMLSTNSGKMLSQLAHRGFICEGALSEYTKGISYAYMEKAIKNKTVKKAFSTAEKCRDGITERAQAWMDFRVALCAAIKIDISPIKTIINNTQDEGPIEVFSEKKLKKDLFTRDSSRIAAQLVIAYGLELQLQKDPEVFRHTHKGYLTFQPSAPLSTYSPEKELPLLPSFSDSDTSYEESSEYSCSDNDQGQSC